MRHVFTNLSLPRSPLSLDSLKRDDVNFDILSDVPRETFVFFPGFRSKFVVRPEAVKFVGVHNVLQYFKKEYRPYNFAPEEALLYHLKQPDDLEGFQTWTDAPFKSAKNEIERNVWEVLQRLR